MDFSKYGLDEETSNKLKADYDKEIEKVKSEAVKPYSDYEKLKKSLETATATQKEHEKTINKLTKEKENFEQQFNNSLMDNAINKAFYDENIKHSELFASKIDKSKLVKDENGNYIGLKEQIDSIKETYKDLLDKSSNTTVGATPPVSAYNPPQQEVDYSKLSRAEAVEAYKKEMQNNKNRRY